MMNLRNGNLDDKTDKTDHTDPFDQLGPDDKKAAIDVAVAAILIGLRIPSTGKPLYDWMATEFSGCHSLPLNMVRYALRSVGKSLATQNWELTIKKNGPEVTTSFKPQGQSESDKL